VGLQKASGGGSAVTETDPKDKMATANKVTEAALAVERGTAGSALTTLQTIISGDPNLYFAQYSMGVALAQKGQYAEAVKYLHKAVELQPDSAWAHFWIGSSLLKTGDFMTAAVHLEIAAGRLAEFGPAHLALAEAYEKLGRAEDAKKEREKGK